MKKIVLLVLPILALFLGNAQASYPDNLSNILPEDKKLIEKGVSEDEISREQAARLILWAAAKDQCKTSYKYTYRTLEISDEDKQKLQEILNILSLKTKTKVIKALSSNQLKMQRQGGRFTVYAIEDKQASFDLSFFQGKNTSYYQCCDFFTDYMKKMNASQSIMEDLLEAAFSLYQRNFFINISSIYKAYVSREDADLGVVVKFLDRVCNFSNSHYKTEIYIAYLNHGYPKTYVVGELTRPIVAELLNQAHSLSNHLKRDFYEAYIKYLDADLAVVNDLVNRAHTFPEEYLKMPVYAAYIAHADANSGVIHNLVNWVCGSDSYIMDMEKVYTAYIGRENADLAVVNDLVNRAHTFPEEYLKVPVYAAYIARADADLSIVNDLLNRAHAFSDNNCKLNIYRAYLLNFNIHEDAEVKKVINALETIDGGSKLLEQYDCGKAFKRKKSARNVPGGKRSRSDFDDNGGDGNDVHPKRHKTD